MDKRFWLAHSLLLLSFNIATATAEISNFQGRLPCPKVDNVVSPASENEAKHAIRQASRVQVSDRVDDRPI